MLNTLNKVEFIDITDKINVKDLTARTYYELKEYEPLSYHIDSSKHFLVKNKKVSSYLRKLNVNFFNYLHSFVKAVMQNDTNRLMELKKNVMKENEVNNKLWLLEKLEQVNFS